MTHIYEIAMDTTNIDHQYITHHLETSAICKELLKQIAKVAELGIHSKAITLL